MVKEIKSALYSPSGSLKLISLMISEQQINQSINQSMD
jgi:hypothetical protein